MSVRKFIVWNGRVVPNTRKPSGITDRARAWTDRPSWLLKDSSNLNTKSRDPRQLSKAPPTWPISKYNPMSQHNPLSKQIEYPERRHHPVKVREPGGASVRGGNKIHTEGVTLSVKVPKASVFVDSKAQRVRGAKFSPCSTAQVRKLARSIERAYDVPSPHTRSKVNIRTPTIVITQDVFANHHHRSKEKLVSNAPKDRVNRRPMRSAAQGGTKRKTPPLPRSTSSTLQLPIEPPRKDAPRRRRIDGLTSANGTPLASSDTLPTKSRLTSSTRRPLPNFPQPPTAHSATSQPPIPHRPLARSQNTGRRKRHPDPAPHHRPAKPAATDPRLAPASRPSALEPTTPPRRAAAIESPSNHSRTSSKSLATFASSDFSDAYTLGRAMPVPIIPTSFSRTVPGRMVGKEKPLPRLPVVEVLGPELVPERHVYMGKNESENNSSRVEGGGRDASGPTTRSAMEG